MDNNIKKFSISALFIAIAYAVSFVKIIRMPLGGSVTLMSMLAISLPAYFFGKRYGFMASVIYAILQIIQGGTIISIPQVMLDYVLAFSCFGIVAFYSNKKNGLQIGFFIACTIRLICSTLSGYIFFADYAPKAWNPVLYSFVYNACYIYGECIISIIIISIPQVKNLIKKYKSIETN